MLYVLLRDFTVPFLSLPSNEYLFCRIAVAAAATRTVTERSRKQPKTRVRTNERSDGCCWLQRPKERKRFVGHENWLGNCGCTNGRPACGRTDDCMRSQRKEEERDQWIWPPIKTSQFGDSLPFHTGGESTHPRSRGVIPPLKRRSSRRHSFVRSRLSNPTASTRFRADGDKGDVFLTSAEVSQSLSLSRGEE